MSFGQTYRDWVRVRKHVDIHPEFAARVMDRIVTLEARTRGAPCGWAARIEKVSASWWAKAAVVGVAVGAGIGRIVLTLHLILLP